ncbi:3-oxoacyl-ACP synthase III family protein [Micromonospora eburnea]|uniref:3-oxoacyl-[acyl-carrier-protein] synthase-3 n=1 Tax=Micromonospora eburnea TaxID=227316 RepID=A0A1C6V0Q6_9ACTN|nr:3-oxoacyl-ACP synthase III family protein [Micromonospora eburnea]SCL59879.1 3-oxoacyl-[acyl-carrier-protein] synthase-3 [Micromonospora eburnea]
MQTPDIHILSVATALPGPAVDNATLARRFNMPPVWEQWIDSFIGTRFRHFAMDLESGQVRYSLADLGATAAARALDAAGISAHEVDVMVLGTASPDTLMPATVNMIADRIGVDGVPTYQMQSGCCGAFQAMDLAYTMLMSGRRRTALVLGAENCAKHLDLTIDVAALPASEQVNGVLFGDGAGAMVLTTGPAPRRAVIRQIHLQLVGRNRPPGQVVEWFGRGDRRSDRQPVMEDYQAIAESVPLLAAEALEDLLDDLGWQEDDIDYLLPPQLSGVMTRKIVEHLDLPGATEVSCVVDIGNTGNALPFFQLERALSRLATGDRAVAVAVESSKWIKAGLALEMT